MSFTQKQIIACRKMPIPQDQQLFIRGCLAKKDYEQLTHSAYYQELFQTFLFQLSAVAKPNNSPVVLQKAHALTRHFLKRKLGLIQLPVKIDVMETLFDPHHHFNSIYIDQDETLRLLLPDFNGIYEALREKAKPHEIEHNSVNEDEIRDVQHFLNPPRRVHDDRRNQKFFKTHGYARGGAYHAVHSDVDSVDYCGTEYEFDGKDIGRYLNLARKAQVIRFHMGETVIPAQGKLNVKNLLEYLEQHPIPEDKTIRLGHGTHMGIDSMMTCAQKGYFVECCLSSNKETGILEKRHHYPLAVMLLLGVKVVIGTDGGKIYYTDLRSEYGYAEKGLARVNDKIKNQVLEEISLPNGDKLKFKHIKHLYNVDDDIVVDDEHTVTYADLAKIKGIDDILNTETLLDNMKALQTKITKKPVVKTLEEGSAASTLGSEITLTKANLQMMVEQLIINIGEGKGGRWTSGRTSLKIANLKKIVTELEGTSTWNQSLQHEYTAAVREICLIRRHTFHFWSTPDSVVEFEKMQRDVDSEHSADFRRS